MFKCLNCNIEFDEPFRVVTRARNEYEDDVIERYCPCCGSDYYREVIQCEYCGEDTGDANECYCEVCKGNARKVVRNMVKEAIDIFGEDMLDVIDDLLDGNSVRSV